MTAKLTDSIIMEAAEKVRRLIISKSADMCEAFYRVPGNLSVGVSLVWKPSEEPHNINADIGIKFKKSEVADKIAYTFSDGFGPLFDRSRMSGPARITWRDFSEIRAALARSANDK